MERAAPRRAFLHDRRAPHGQGQHIAREKDIGYSSRAVNPIARQKQLHKLRHVIAEPTRKLSDEVREQPEIRALSAYGCMTRMHVVRLLAPTLAGGGAMKDIDFSAEGVSERWRAGRADTARVLERAPWRGAFEQQALHLVVERGDGGRFLDISFDPGPQRWIIYR